MLISASGIAMEMKILTLTLCLLALASGQSGVVKRYDWRTPSGGLQDWPKLTSLLPYERPVVTEPSYPYPDDSRPYAPYSAEYPSPYQYPDHLDQGLASYEQPQPYYSVPKEPLNMTTARIGGFAGSGDTRGFGAYDFPKSHHHSEEDEGEARMMQKELRELIKLSRDHNRGVHPIPPPL